MSEVKLPSSAYSQNDGLKIRREILERIKTQVRLYLGRETAAIRSYALAYKKDIERSRWKASSQDEFIESLKDTHVIFGGDFHAFAQAQRAHLRNLRNLLPYKKIILAVECIPSQFQKVLDLYMQKKISEGDFLKKIKWEKNWGFSWGQYKPLFDIVREHGGRCLALNEVSSKKKPRTLRQRDQHAVKNLALTYQNMTSDEALYVLYGDLHIARERLPGLFKKSVARFKKARVISVYLNPEKIYFELFKKNLEHEVSVVKFSKDEYCLIESPPWVKWQSYLIFLEETMDESLFDDDGSVDYSEHVHSLLKMISSDLGIDYNIEPSVYSFNDHDFLDLLSEKMTANEFTLAKQFVQNDIGFYQPQSKTAFLPRATVNYAAHLAGHIFHSEYCKKSNFSGPFPQCFIVVIWCEAMAFFLSKLVNPHRKSLQINDLKKQLAAFSPGDGGEEALKLALDQKMRELLMVYGADESESAKFQKKQSILNFYKAAKLLGAMMGERIYKVFKAGRLSRSQIIEWLEKPVEQENFKHFYIQTIKDLDRIEAGDGYG